MSRWRARFATGEGIYLLSHSVGRPPVDVEAALGAGFFQAWVRGDGEPWPAWLDIVDTFRERLGTLLNARPAQICPQTNLSGALARLVGGLAPLPGREVLLLAEDDFPSMGFVLEQAERLGYRRRFLPAGADAQDPAAWSAALADDVRLVLLTHVQSNTGRCLPVAEIAAIARARGVLSVVDVAQSAGVLPVDVAAIGADAVLGSCVKWLCGGPGAGFLWAGEELLRVCRPVDVGWFSHAEPFEFDIHRFRHAPDARRFWGGTPSVLPFAVAGHALGLVGEIGVAAVRAHNLALGARLIAALPPGALRSPADAERRGGTLIVHAGAAQPALAAGLRAAAVQFDERASGIRLSPHVYTLQAEIDTVIDCLREACR